MLVGRGQVGLQVGFHGWQVGELLSAVATLPPVVVIIEDILLFVFLFFCLGDLSKDLPVDLSRLADLGLLLKLNIMASGSLEVKVVKS